MRTWSSGCWYVEGRIIIMEDTIKIKPAVVLPVQEIFLMPGRILVFWHPLSCKKKRDKASLGLNLHVKVGRFFVGFVT
jgi:hypothetical protein